MDKIIDFHTHAFPDKLAERAIKSLEGEGEIKAHLNGTVSALLSSMDRYGIEKSVVCSIATKPAQFDSIFGGVKKSVREGLSHSLSCTRTTPGSRTRLPG